jgi:hypothetical protein
MRCRRVDKKDRRNDFQKAGFWKHASARPRTTLQSIAGMMVELQEAAIHLLLWL